MGCMISKNLYTFNRPILAVFQSICNHHPKALRIFMLFDKKADLLCKHLVFYDTLLYNKESIPADRGVKHTKNTAFLRGRA